MRSHSCGERIWCRHLRASKALEGHPPLLVTDFQYPFPSWAHSLSQSTLRFGSLVVAQLHPSCGPNMNRSSTKMCRRLFINIRIYIYISIIHIYIYNIQKYVILYIYYIYTRNSYIRNGSSTSLFCCNFHGTGTNSWRASARTACPEVARPRAQRFLSCSPLERDPTTRSGDLHEMKIWTYSYKMGPPR